MNKENMLLWADKLDQLGPEMQTRGKLKDTNTGRMCCLGVACEVAMVHGVNLKISIGEFSKDCVSYDDENAVLPQKVMHWLGLNASNPIAAPGISFAELNDIEDYSFAQIAEVIREMVDKN